jgi:hypothetical protein
MNYSKIATKLQSKISKFSGYVSRKLDKTLRRFVSEAIYGILSSQSVMLTEIGRSFETEISIKKIEERYSRQLNKKGLWSTIHNNILQSASGLIKEDTLLILDLSDIHKKYAKEMEYLAEVRDGSQGGQIVKGYWTNQVIATEVNSNEVIPLYSDLYSQESPEFKSENDEIIKAIEIVGQHTSNRGIWVIDRGGDRERLYSQLLGKNKLWLNKRGEDQSKRFIIRMVGTRNLICGNKEQQALHIAEKCKYLYSETVVRQIDGQEKVYNISYGYFKVKLPNHEDKQLYLLVVKGFGEKPMMILTTEKLRKNRSVLQRILYSYLRRWSIEETIRFIKQSYELENIRVLKYRRLKNMMALLLAAFYFTAVVLDGSQKLKIMLGHIIRQAKRVFGIPSFKYYAVGDGMSAILKRLPKKINQALPSSDDQLIMNLEFT